MTYRYVSDRALRVGQIALLGEAVVRGVNYVTAPAGQFAAMNQVEDSASLWAWGTVYISLGVLGWLGEALMSGTEFLPGPNPRAWPSFLAHTALMCIYLALALGSFVAVMQQHPQYGWLNTYDLLGGAVGNWIFARRRRRDA